MSSRVKSLVCGLMGAGLLALGGCATHVADLPAALNPVVAKGEVTVPDGGVISIRYPMLASDSARQQLLASYACKYNNFIDHPMSSCGNPGFTPQFAPLLFEQSTYYAAELKRIMSRYVDDRAVRLEPQWVDYRDGNFVVAPALPNTSPSVLVIELYDFPSAVKAVVGSGYQPQINIRSAGSVSPQTCGNLLVVAEHHKFDAANAKDCAGRDARSTPSFLPLRYFAEQAPAVVDFPKQSDKPIGPGAVLASKTLWEKNNEDYLTRSSQPDYTPNVDTIQNATSDWIARTAASALGRIDTQMAFEAGFAGYVQSYDPELATRLRNRAALPADARKVAVLRKLLAAENDWLASQNAAIAEGILTGSYGQSFRKSRLLLAEGYRKSQAMGWLQVGAVLASGFNSGLLGGGAGYNPSMLMTQTLQNEQQFSAMQAQIEQTLIASLAPGVEMRNKVVKVSIDDINANISGASQSEIHEQLKALYKKLAKA